MDTTNIFRQIGTLETLSKSLKILWDQHQDIEDSLRQEIVQWIEYQFKDEDLERADRLFIISNQESFDLVDLLADRLTDAISSPSFCAIAFPTELAPRFIKTIQENLPFKLLEKRSVQNKEKIVTDAERFNIGTYDGEYSIYRTCYERGWKFYEIKMNY